MRYKIINIFFALALFIFSSVSAKENNDLVAINGKITFITSQNIYVRFESTSGINVNDTLYTVRHDKKINVMVVKYISSNSCSGSKIGNLDLKVGEIIFAMVGREEAVKVVESVTGGDPNDKSQSISNQVQSKFGLIKSGGFAKRTRGRLSISSYSNISNNNGNTDIQKWRYSFSYSADSIGSSPVSFTSYTNFIYRTDEWADVKNSLGNAFKFYEFAFQYDVGKKSRFFIGRKINPKTSNLGAVDGLQFETGLGNRTALGIVAGTRPSFSDYGFDIKLFEYGGYLYRNDSIGTITMQNTLGLFQQTNNSKTDRRFLYFQHTNTLTNSLRFFFSSEFDMYKRKNGIGKNTFDMTSLFLMSTFRPASWFILNATFDSRKNIYYYETFRNIADSLLTTASRQGVGLRINVRPFGYVWLSGNFNYRFSANDPKPSRNFGGSISYSNIPLIASSMYLTYNRLETGYLSGNDISARIDKDIFNGDINVGFGFRKIEYKFSTDGTGLIQKIADMDLTWRVFTFLFLTTSYEGTFQGNSSYSNFFTTLNFRF